MGILNITRGTIVPVLTAATGTGAGTQYFVKDSVPRFHGEPGTFVFGLYNVVGTFTVLTINLEFTPVLGAQAYWETVNSWSPLTQPMMVAQCSEAGFYRMNVTAFSGGTQLDVWCTIGNSPAGELTFTGTVTATNPSVGTTNATAPTSATEVGMVDAGGKLQAVSATNPLPITGSISASNPSVSSLDAAIPSSGTLVAGSDGTDLRALVTDTYGRLKTVSSTPLGADLVAFAFNQLEINFSVAFSSAWITNSIVTTGTHTQANGQATYGTGTGAAGEGKGVSVQALEYRPGHTWYSLFTAVFGTPAASSYQRIGPYNSTDGFWIGYEGTTFGLTRFLAGAATQTAKASWNGDPLDGSAGSNFTSNGSPVVWNPAKGNIYRLQGSWFGFAPVQLDILSPDGTWVTAHTFRNPNTLTSPYAATTNWNMTIDVANTGNTSNITTSTACWAMGTLDQNTIVSSTITDQTLATQVRAVLAGKTPSGNNANVGFTPDDALSVGGSGDTNVGAAPWTTITGSQIASVGGASNQGTGISTLTTTYAPTTGNTVVVTFNTSGSVTALTVKDSHGTSLTAGPTIGNLASFYMTAASGTTGFVAAWTGSVHASLCVQEYSGVATVNPSLTGNTNSGSSPTASITVTPNETSDIVVCALADTGNTLTGTVGNTRQQVTTTNSRQLLMDTTASPAICTATLSSSAWNAAAIGLRPTIISGTALNTALVLVNNSFAYNTVAIQMVSSGTVNGGSVTSEVSIDNVNWIPLIGVNTSTGVANASAIFSLASLAVTGLIFNITGYNYFRLRLSAQVTGYLGQVAISYNLQGLASPNVSSTITNGNITVNDNQGLPNTLANAWPVQITDSTNGPAAVKAGSTAAVAADSSVVVQLHPSQPNLTTALNVHDPSPASVAVTNVGTFAVQAASTIADGSDVTQGAKTDAKNIATDGTSVSVVSILKEISYMEQTPASRAVTNAGTFAVQAACSIADGSDVTLGTKTDAKNTATDGTSVSVIAVLKEISYMEQTPASRAVTNAGTFAVQASIAAAQTIAVTNTGTFAVQNVPTDGTHPISAAMSAIGTAPTGTYLETVNSVSIPYTAGGLSANLQTALKSTAASVKTSAGQIYGYTIFNPNAAVAYVSWYDASSTPTVGTSMLFAIGIPAGAAANVFFDLGIAVANKIYVGASTAIGSAADPTTGLVVTTLYK